MKLEEWTSCFLGAVYSIVRPAALHSTDSRTNQILGKRLSQSLIDQFRMRGTWERALGNCLDVLDSGEHADLRVVSTSS
jgi:hypothetical protein